MRSLATIVVFAACCWIAAASSLAAEPTKVVHFTVDTSKDVRTISPFIYGVNAHLVKGSVRPLVRLGGNRWTAYNWENNASNAGADWHHQSDGSLSESNVAGQAVRPAVEVAGRNGQALVVTVPMAGYVSADKSPEGDVNQTPDYLNKRFRVSVAKKNAPLSLEPDAADSFVCQDEFVNWVEKSARVDSRQVIFYALDNEPDLWAQNHLRIHPKKVTYDEMVKRTVEWASAIKDVKPDALVFGAVNYGWNGYRTLQNAPDANGRDFHQIFLAELKKAEAKAGRRLIDVLDVHWYPEARGGADAGIRINGKATDPDVARARVQAPRSLWDPTYVETSWITKDSTRGQPIQLLSRMQKDIDTHYPGTKIGITEYNYGAGNHISGGIAQADVLGIFGRYGVFAAAWWDEGNGSDYVNAAIDTFLNYNGKGDRFGNRSVSATTEDIESTSIYASIDEPDASRVTLVLINRAEHDVSGDVSISHTSPLNRAEAFQLTGAGPTIKSIGEFRVTKSGMLSCALPAMSVTTVRLSQ